MKRITKIISGLMLAVLFSGPIGAALATDVALLLQELNKKKASGESIKLTDFSEVIVGLGKVIPSKEFQLFSGFAIETPKINEAPAGFKGFEVTGKGIFGPNKYPVDVKMTIVERASLPAKPEEPKKEDVIEKIESPEGDAVKSEPAKPAAPKETGPLMVGNYEMSFTIIFPKDFALAKVIPAASDVKYLNTMTFPSGRFIASTYAYTDAKLEVDVEKGLNFIAEVDAKGPFQAIASLKNKLPGSVSKMILVDGGKIILQMLIADPLNQSNMSGKLPLQIGVDFTKIAQQKPDIKALKFFSDIIQQISTNEFEFKLGIDKVQAAASAKIVIGGQKEPFTPVLGGTVWTATGNKSGFSFFANLKQTLDLGYIALGNMGVQIDFDDTLTEVALLLGVPFTGVGMRGQLMLGEPSVKRATVDMAGSISLNSKGSPDFVFEGKGTNLNFNDFIYFAAKQSVRGGMAVEKALLRKQLDISPEQLRRAEQKAAAVIKKINEMPTFNIQNVELYIAPIATTIANKKYPAGFSGQFDVQLFDKKLGMVFNMPEDYSSITYTGYLPVIKAGNVFSIDRSTKFKGQEILGSKESGPTVEMKIDMKEPKDSKFTGNGKMQLLGMIGEADLILNKDGVEASAKFAVGDAFNLELFNTKLDLENPTNSRIGLRLDNKAQDLLAKEIQKIASLDAATIQRDIDALNTRLKKAQDDKNYTVYVTNTAFNATAKKTRDSITACWNDFKKNPITLKVPESCKSIFKNVGEIATKSPGLLKDNADKFISTAMTSAYTAVNNLNKEIETFKKLQTAANSLRDQTAKAVSSWFNIKNAVASVDLRDSSGRMTYFTIDAVILGKSVQAKNVSFDTAGGPVKFIEEAGKKLFTEFKK